jgi:hypothetical protein
MTLAPGVDIAVLERQRRLCLRAAAIALMIASVGCPVGMTLGGSDTFGAIAGACQMAAIAGIIAAPWIVRGWQSFMRRRMIAAAVSGRPDIHHIDAENQQAASAQALASDAFTLAAFRDSGLVEAFESASVSHILSGDTQGVPFAVAELRLLNAKGYAIFSGVLASFRLVSPRPGLTIVARDRGMLGNLLARAGSGIERLPLEDPTFEGVFEVYGTDQVGGRVILTTTMLERLKTLDDLAHAHGFACAFHDEHLLITFRGMSWRCPSKRILEPVGTWLDAYAQSLAGLVDLPVDIVHTLNLAAPSTIAASPFAPAVAPAIPIDTSSGQVFTSALWRLIGEGGMPLANLASGALFGGVALLGAWYGIKEGYSQNLFWYFWGLIAVGLVYGAVTVSGSMRELVRLAWGWDAPLRNLKRQ